MKTLILLFNDRDFTISAIKSATNKGALSIAKKGVENAICDIYTIEDFFAVWNETPHDLDGYIAKPVQVDDAEYNEWWK